MEIFKWLGLWWLIMGLMTDNQTMWIIGLVWLIIGLMDD